MRERLGLDRRSYFRRGESGDEWEEGARIAGRVEGQMDYTERVACGGAGVAMGDSGRR